MIEETDDTFDTDQWANTIGEDDELDRLWAALTEATALVEPAALEMRLAQHLGGLGARARRTTEGLILAASAAMATEGPSWEGPLWQDPPKQDPPKQDPPKQDWRVILHRHFARDERMDVAVAAAILLELRKSAATPDWQSASARVMERVVRSLVRDMQLEIEAIDQGPLATSASAHLATLASELFDVAIALTGDQMEELQNSPEVAALLGDLLRRLGEPADGEAKPVMTNLTKARALVEVTIRQLELGAAVVH